jgi:hypothetical protein
MKNLLPLFIFSALFSCSPEEATLTKNTEQNYTTALSGIVLNDYLATPAIDVPLGTLFYQNVPYGTDQRQVIDIFLPPIASGFSVTAQDVVDYKDMILNIHDGDFKSGDKSAAYHLDNEIYKYLSSNIAFVSMNYRFLNTSEQDNRGVTTSFKDAENVLNFIRSNTNKLYIDTNRIFIRGNGFAGSSITQYLLSQPFYGSKVRGVSMNDPMSSLDFLDFNDTFSEFDFDLYSFISEQDEQMIVGLYGGIEINQLESEDIIIKNRETASFTSAYENFSGRVRITALDYDVSYQTLENVKHLIRHQLNSIEIYNKAMLQGLHVDAQIPHLHLQNDQSELDFILDTFL